MRTQDKTPVASIGRPLLNPCDVKRAYDREHTPYGFCVNMKTYQHYLFNRDYLVLPTLLPPSLLVTAMATAQLVHKASQLGHGRYLPSIKPEEIADCVVYHFFHDGTAPKWKEKTRNYDQTPYENR